MSFRLSLFLLLFVYACSQPQRNVGDIPFDKNADDPEFKICTAGPIKQYYIRGSTDTPPGYKGEKRELEREILRDYDFPETASEDGYLTIRFIVNCEGKTGRNRTGEVVFGVRCSVFGFRCSGSLTFHSTFLLLCHFKKKPFFAYFAYLCEKPFSQSWPNTKWIFQFPVLSCAQRSQRFFATNASDLFYKNEHQHSSSGGATSL